MRRATGIAVFAGMLGVTLFGIFLTPVFYALLRRHRAAPYNAPLPCAPRWTPPPTPSTPVLMTRRRASDADPSHHIGSGCRRLSSSRPVPRPPCWPAGLAPSLQQGGRCSSTQARSRMAQAFEGSAVAGPR